MNRTVRELLQGYLFRSAWLYAFFGVAQFCMTGVYWLRGWGRMPVAGMALGLWGAAAALNANSLVWRSLPLSFRDASVFRWWAIAGAPGLYATLLTGIVWVSQHSSGFQTPTPDVIWEGVFASWAVLGVVAAVFRSPQFYRRPMWAKANATVACATIALFYGVPVGSGARPYSIVFIAIGMVLLISSAARAYEGKHWRWPDMSGRTSATAKKAGVAPVAYRYGIWTVLLPLLRRTAIVASLATALAVLLHVLLPRAGVALSWIYFICISTAGYVFTFQIRLALQALRCLPLSTKQLAGLLLVLGALPGIATLGPALLVSRALLDVDMNFSAVGAFALIVIAAQALPLTQENARVQGFFLGRWFPLAQRILFLGYLAFLGATTMQNGAFAALWWFRWGIVAGGVALCLSGYFILVHQLRAGIRPSSNERLLSPG